MDVRLVNYLHLNCFTNKASIRVFNSLNFVYFDDLSWSCACIYIDSQAVVRNIQTLKRTVKKVRPFKNSIWANEAIMERCLSCFLSDDTQKPMTQEND